MKRERDVGDTTMRYMQRFGCIGAECEDNCCHGWTVEIDPLTHERMKKLTQLHSPEERRRYAAAVAEVDRRARSAEERARR